MTGDRMAAFTICTLRLSFPAVLLVAGSLPVSAESTPKVIYGTDDRLDWHEETHPERLALARSTCLLRRGAVVDNGDGTWTLNGLPPSSVWLEPIGVVPLCETERFNDQPVLGDCSGFLVASDIVATASHCLFGNLEFVKFVFNVYMIDENTPRLVIDDQDLYFADEVIGRMPNDGSGEDWALIRLDRPVTSPGAVPLPTRRSGIIGLGEKVGVIGHPLGLPGKIAWGDDTIVRDNTRPSQFIANLDAYGGNSGSAVFNQTTGIVEGIIFGGEVDYVLMGNCAATNVVPNDGGAGEGVMRSTVAGFQSLIPVASPAGPPVIDDSAKGNGNGLIDPDDSNIEILFPVRNVDEKTLTGVTGALSSTDPNVVPGDANAAWPSMDPGSTHTADTSFTFSIKPEHDFGTPVPVTLSLTLPDNGGTRDYTFMLETQKPVETQYWGIR